MKRSILLGLLSLAVVLVGLQPAARGCAVARKKEDMVKIVNEKAIIVWDEKTQTEHFIRRAHFETSAAYFGFLVPTPSQPQIADLPDAVFNQLEEWSKPERRTETKIEYYSLFGDIGPAAGTMFVGAAADRAKSVQVIDRVQVAGGEAVILKANDAAKLREWLQKHGYEARPELEEWLKWYTDNGWYLTAFQFKRGEQPANGMAPEAVRLSFKTKRPFYPYREPADARADKTQERRSLRVFFVGTGRYAGKLEGAGETWPGRAAHAKPLSAEQGELLTKQTNSDKPEAALQAERVSLPEGAWLTVFDDEASPRPGTGEVYFARDDDQEELARPPIITYVTERRVYPSEIIGLWSMAGIVLIGGIWIVWRFGLRKAD